MSKPYPFDTFEDMWPYVSQIDASFDIERMHSRLLLAKKDVESIIGKSTYKLINDAFWNDSTTADEKVENAFEPLQGAISNFGLYRQYIWLVMKVSASGVTQRSSDEYKSVTQSMSTEAKNDLLNSANMFMDDLISVLDVGGDTFPEWQEIQSKKPQILLFTGVSDFDNVLKIGNSQFFYNLLLPKIEEIERVKVKSRFSSIETITDDIKYNIRKAVAYDSMSEAIAQYDYHLLPEPVRHDLDRLSTANYARSHSSADLNIPMLKTGLRGYYAEKASDYYKIASEILTNQQNKVDTTLPIPYETLIFGTDDDKCITV